jgi:5-methylcytosine-specific restriction protein A
MTSPPEDISVAAGLIETATRTPFTVGVESNGGMESWALRIALGGDSPAAAIFLTSSPYSAVATLVPDTFSGRLLRYLGDQAAAVAEEWQSLVEGFEADGTKIAIDINGSPCGPSESGRSEWQAIEIEATTRISRPITSATRGQALASSALGVLTLFAACTDFDVDQVIGEAEGAGIHQESIRHERKAANRIMCLNHHGYDCAACGFNFSEQYGSLGAGFVEVHHIFTVASMPPGYRPNPITEMVPLCANCHRMVHRTTPPLDPLELTTSANRK